MKVIFSPGERLCEQLSMEPNSKILTIDSSVIPRVGECVCIQASAIDGMEGIFDENLEVVDVIHLIRDECEVTVVVLENVIEVEVDQIGLHGEN